jgi:hypothetical protein
MAGAFRLAGRGGWDTEIVPPSLETLDDLKAVSVDIPLELSAIAARREALPRAVTPSPGLPGGEVALLEALLRHGRCRSIHAAVSEVRMRGVHHGESADVLERLRGVLHGPLGDDDAVAARVRRRALEVAFLESHPSVAARFAPEQWWEPVRNTRGADGLMDALRDLHWIAARLSEAHHIAARGFDGVVAEAPVDVQCTIRPDVNDLLIAIDSLRGAMAELTATIHWLHGEVRVRDNEIARLQEGVSDKLRALSLELVDLRSSNEALHRAVADRDNTVRWLHDEVRARDEQSSRLRAGLAAAGLDGVSGWTLAGELRARFRRRVGRLLRGGRS